MFWLLGRSDVDLFLTLKNIFFWHTFLHFYPLDSNPGCLLLKSECWFGSRWSKKVVDPNHCDADGGWRGGGSYLVCLFGAGLGVGHLLVFNQVVDKVASEQNKKLTECSNVQLGPTSNGSRNPEFEEISAMSESMGFFSRIFIEFWINRFLIN